MEPLPIDRRVQNPFLSLAPEIKKNQKKGDYKTFIANKKKRKKEHE